MAMRKDQIPDNKFTLPLDARELALYTRQITKNAKVFDLEIDASACFGLPSSSRQERNRHLPCMSSMDHGKPMPLKATRSSCCSAWINTLKLCWRG